MVRRLPGECTIGSGAPPVDGHAKELARINRELAATVEELDAFAYVDSHDLKEPLRGIHNYAAFLIEDYEGKLGPDGEANLRARYLIGPTRVTGPNG